MQSRNNLIKSPKHRGIRGVIPYITSLILLTLIYTPIHAKVSALWVTPWDLNTPEKAAEVIEKALEWGITDLLVEVRYRADAFYKPNKTFHNFPNNEPTSHLLSQNPDFDVLQYFIDNTRNKSLRVHAWVTVNVITPRMIDVLGKDHLYFQKPEWLTYNSQGEVINHTQFEGAYLDPGLVEVQNYLTNVFSDIVQNYDIVGLHLDYIRYPSPEYGYHRKSIERFNQTQQNLKIDDFQHWKELCLQELVNRIGRSIKQIKPEIIYSVAAIPNISTARSRYAQNWYAWLDSGVIDNVYLMAYQTRNSDFAHTISTIPYEYRNRIIVGLRAWADDGSYHINGLRDKISLTPDHYSGLAFFSYGGIISRNYEAAIKEYMPRKIEGYVYGFDKKPLRGARITHANNPNLFTFSDKNGYFFISTNNIMLNDFICTYMNFSQIKTVEFNKPLIFDLPIFTSFSFNFSGIDADRGFFLWWDRTDASLYRKSISDDSDYTLIGKFDRNTNFYYDLNIRQSDRYEYRLVHNNVQSYVYKTYPKRASSLIELKVYYLNQNIVLEIINETQVPGRWFLEDVNSTIVSYGDLGAKNEIVRIPESHLNNRYLLFVNKFEDRETTTLIDMLNLKERAYAN